MIFPFLFHFFFLFLSRLNQNLLHSCSLFDIQHHDDDADEEEDDDDDGNVLMMMMMTMMQWKSMKNNAV